MKQCSRSHVRVVATVLMLCVVLTGVGCTQRDGSSRGILMEGRIAPLMPTDSSDRWLLTRDRVDRYIKDLADNGPQPGHRRGDAFLWFPSRDLAGKPSEIIISKYKERWYVLVCNQPDRIMLPRKNGRQVWGLIKCEAYPDEERGNLIFEFDYAGEQRFDRLRKQNPRRPLLFLIDGKFHISVWPGPKHDPNALLGYKIFEEPPPVSEVAEALRIGMPPVVPWPQVAVTPVRNARDDSVELAIKATGKYGTGAKFKVGGKPADSGRLAETLAGSMRGRQPKGSAISLRLDKPVRWEFILQAALEAKRAGFEHIQIIVPGMEGRVLQSTYRPGEPESRIVVKIPAKLPLPPGMTVSSISVLDENGNFVPAKPADYHSDVVSARAEECLIDGYSLPRRGRAGLKDRFQRCFKEDRNNSSSRILELRVDRTVAFESFEPILRAAVGAGISKVYLRQSWTDEE